MPAYPVPPITAVFTELPFDSPACAGSLRASSARSSELRGADPAFVAVIEFEFEGDIFSQNLLDYVCSSAILFLVVFSGPELCHSPDHALQFFAHRRCAFGVGADDQYGVVPG